MLRTREAAKAEAIKRMHKLDLHASAIKAFEKEGKIWMSEPPIGGLYEIDSDLQAEISRIEQNYNVVVYHVVKSYMLFGKCSSCLVVSLDDEDWYYDSRLEQQGCVYTYTINHSEPSFSEFGSIMVDRMYGGLVRRG